MDGVLAAEVHAAFHEATKSKRILTQSDCTGNRLNAVNAAISQAQTYAEKAASAASAGTNLEEYFHSTDNSTKNTVVDVFNTIADSVLSSGSSGAAKLYCTDVANGCSDGVVAYTSPGQSDEYVSNF